MRLYDRLFAVPYPGRAQSRGARADGVAAEMVAAHGTVVAGEDDDEEAAEPVERNWLDDLNPDSKRVITAYVEPALAEAVPEERFQFERHGYFVADALDHDPGSRCSTAR